MLSEAILLLRGVPAKNAAAHRSSRLKSADDAYEIHGKTLGIVGYGSIGTQLSVLAEALGMHVVFFDVATKLSQGNAREVPELHDQPACARAQRYAVDDRRSCRLQPRSWAAF